MNTIHLNQLCKFLFASQDHELDASVSLILLQLDRLARLVLRLPLGRSPFQSPQFKLDSGTFRR